MNKYLVNFLLLLYILLICSCGGSSGDAVINGNSSNTSSPLTNANASNQTTITVDSGPSGVSSYNVPFVSITICAPNSTNCQTIDHISVDTGSIGLRIIASAINPDLLSKLPFQIDSNNNYIAECFQYVSSYVWGSIRNFDLKIGGEISNNISGQIIADSDQKFSSIPSSCNSSGGTQTQTVKSFGANGIIGIGFFKNDCGVTCTQIASNSLYYACNTSNCTQSIMSEEKQIKNPISTFSTNNNGSLITFPSPNITGQSILYGTLTFGINTQSNNLIDDTKKVLTVDPSSGYLKNTIYNGNIFYQTYLDTGTNGIGFVDNTLPTCYGVYCPSANQNLSATLMGFNNVSVNANFEITNSLKFDYSNAVFPGFGFYSGASIFSWGLPFFFGRSVYTRISNMPVSGMTSEPFIAF